MIDGLLMGRLYAKPVARTSRNGTEFVTVALLVAVNEGATLYVSGCAFDGEARRALLALNKGDSIAVTGPLVIGLFKPDDGAPPRPSVSVTIQAVLSPYDVRRRRAVIQDARRPVRDDREPAADGGGFNDDHL